MGVSRSQDELSRRAMYPFSLTRRLQSRGTMRLRGMMVEYGFKGLKAQW